MKVKPITEKMYVFFSNNLSRNRKDKQLELLSVPGCHFLSSYAFVLGKLY